MPARSKARKRALDVLFASELRGEDPVAALDRAISEGEGPTNDYTGFLVRGVTEHRAQIDQALAYHPAILDYIRQDPDSAIGLDEAASELIGIFGDG